MGNGAAVARGTSVKSLAAMLDSDDPVRHVIEAAPPCVAVDLSNAKACFEGASAHARMYQSFDVLCRWILRPEGALSELNLMVSCAQPVSFKTASFDIHLKLHCFSLAATHAMHARKNNDLGHAGVSSLAAIIRQRRNLTKLNLGGNRIANPECAQGLLQFLMAVPRSGIRSLSLCSNGLEPEHAQPIADMVKCAGSPLTSLDLSHNRGLGSSGGGGGGGGSGGGDCMRILMSAFCGGGGGGVSTLDMSRCGVGGRHVQVEAVADALRAPGCTLSALSLNFRFDLSTVTQTTPLHLPTAPSPCPLLHSAPATSAPSSPRPLIPFPPSPLLPPTPPPHPLHPFTPSPLLPYPPPSP
jgi:hypothetical protein